MLRRIVVLGAVVDAPDDRFASGRLDHFGTEGRWIGRALRACRESGESAHLLGVKFLRLRKARTGKLGGRGFHVRISSVTGLMSSPMPSTATEIWSPGCKNRGGSPCMPVPAGVPVKITVPAGSVVLPLRKAMTVGKSKMNEAVEACWNKFAVETGRQGQ